MNKYLHYLLLLLIVAATACGKKGGTDGGAKTLPTNLNVAATASTDNSGNVAFVATATNAVSYDYDFGDGSNGQTSASGTISYKYAISGTYKVIVTAKSQDGSTTFKTIDVTVNLPVVLRWSEEFNTDGAPDGTKWGYDLGAGDGWGNNELEYYTSRPENVIVSGGTLKITAKRENYNGSNYTSARILTKDKFAFKYGKLEIRAKLPSQGGTWPALWMLGSNITSTPWPGCGEIDIMEHKGNELNKIYSTLHYPGHSGGNGTGSSTLSSNVSTDFHLYTLDWSASTIKVSIDNVEFFSFPNNSSTPFNLNFFIILNVAMGGNFGGAVNTSFTTGTMEVDYIRLYQ